MSQIVPLSANQRKAMIALLNSPSVRSAAAACGLHERTLGRYLADDTFRAELRRRQGEALAAATAALSGLAGKALTVLDRVMDSKDATDAAKLRAAGLVLSERWKAAEMVELVERIGALEEALDRPKSMALGT